MIQNRPYLVRHILIRFCYDHNATPLHTLRQIMLGFFVQATQVYIGERVISSDRVQVWGWGAGNRGRRGRD